jgi:hypothetical protein
MSHLPNQLPGGSEIQGFRFDDQARFIRDIPQLLKRLRTRHPTLAWSLNFNNTGLEALDAYVSKVIDDIQARGELLTSSLSPDWLEEIVAFVGEVIVRRKNGRWQAGDPTNTQGPLVVFQAESMGQSAYRGLDICHSVIVQLVEGNSLLRWYQAEIEASE